MVVEGGKVAGQAGVMVRWGPTRSVEGGEDDSGWGSGVEGRLGFGLT